MAEKCSHADVPPTNIKCPECGKGTLEIARGRFAPIYRCTAEGCEYWVDSRPTGEKCTYIRDGKKCGHLIVEGTKTIPNRCSDRTCPNRRAKKVGKPASDEWESLK